MTRGYDDMTPKLHDTALVQQMSAELADARKRIQKLEGAMRTIDGFAAVAYSEAQATRDAARFQRVRNLIAKALDDTTT
jgi:hypothetical protein